MKVASTVPKGRVDKRLSARPRPISLQEEAIFPLTVGSDYSSRSYPTLVVSRTELVPVFKPLVTFIAKPQINTILS
ncbi:MAG: hypothetical protein EBE86_000750 [Hormoscilla sp. GUM202]|nr:hypothetical protein [Hormoscilla sp. GUM202]